LNISDITNSIKATLYERLSSPLSGFFICSWVLWNWRFVYIVLFADDLKGSERIGFATLTYPINGWNGIVYPAASAVILVTLYPFAGRIAYWTSLWHQKKFNDIFWSFETSKPLSVKDATELRLRYREMEKAISSLTEEKDEKIRSLEAELKAIAARAELLQKPTLIPSIGIEENPELIFTEEQGSVFRNLADKVLTDSVYTDDLNPTENRVVAIALANNLMKRTGNSYDLTDRGKTVYRLVNAR
jgi:hypothetical protein